jgi:hypothetical protein
VLGASKTLYGKPSLKLIGEGNSRLESVSKCLRNYDTGRRAFPSGRADHGGISWRRRWGSGWRISRSLAGAGIPEYEAKRYEGMVKNGGILISVHCDNSEWTSKAKDILEKTGAADVSSTGEASADFAESDKPRPRTHVWLRLKGMGQHLTHFLLFPTANYVLVSGRQSHSRVAASEFSGRLYKITDLLPGMSPV